MDFVIVGIVIGSIIVGCGVIIADLGPRMKPWLTRPDQSSIGLSKLKQSWSRYCKASGSLVSTAGLLMVLVTVLGVVFDVSDSTGMRAVLVASLIALVAVALAIVVIPNHYRTGGFDARSRPEVARPLPPATIVHDVTLPISRLPSDPDDIFVDIPVDEREETESIGAVAGLADPQLDATTADVPKAGEEIAIEPAVAREVTSLEPFAEEFAPDQELEPAVISEEPTDDVEIELGTAFEPWVAEPRGPVAASRAAYERTQSGRIESTPPPLVDPPLLPIDDELPAWNAPVPVIETPEVVYSPEPLRTEPTHQQLAGGFESSLFADLEVPRDESAEEEGKFKSRLLNELTGETDEEIEPVADVLLDEFSLPQPGEPGSRGVGNG